MTFQIRALDPNRFSSAVSAVGKLGDARMQEIDTALAWTLAIKTDQ